MKSKKLLYVLVSLLLITAILLPIYYNSTSLLIKQSKNPNIIAIYEESDKNADIKTPSKLYSRYCALIDGDSNRVLFEQNGFTAAPMASTTKIMTCILAIELCPLTYECITSPYAASMPDVQLDLVAGEKATLKDLLYSLMLRSHNDTAVVIAENVACYCKNIDNASLLNATKEYSQSLVADFVKIMNTKARELNASSAHFVTPNGLDATDSEGPHSINAIDLCKIMAYCIKNEHFLEITQTRSYSVKTNKRTIPITNANTFLDMMSGVISGKTGFTGDAGYCYVCALKRADKTYICALLVCGWPNNRSYKWSDAKKILNHGINYYESIDLISNLRMPKLSNSALNITNDICNKQLINQNESILYIFDDIQKNGDCILNIIVD